MDTTILIYVSLLISVINLGATYLLWRAAFKKSKPVIQTPKQEIPKKISPVVPPTTFSSPMVEKSEEKIEPKSENPKLPEDKNLNKWYLEATGVAEIGRASCRERVCHYV